jgi:hypothetical protein
MSLTAIIFLKKARTPDGDAEPIDAQVWFDALRPHTTAGNNRL